jgi:hypothetical protein
VIPSTNPFSEGWREVRRDAQGVAIGKLRPEEAPEARAKKFAADMKKYAAKSAAAEQERIDRAAGVRHEPDPEPEKPFDELDLVLQQLRAQPHLLNGRGPLGDQLVTDTRDARRARDQARLEAARTEAVETLTKWVSPTKDDDDEVYDYQGISDKEADSLIEQGDEDDEDLDWLNDVEVGEVNEL